MSLLEKLTGSEQKLLFKILDQRAAKQLNGFTKKFEKEILIKTETQSLTELLSKLHAEVIHSEGKYNLENSSIEFWLNDHRLKKFQLFTDQSVRILDLQEKKYLYLNDANENLTGIPNEEFLTKGLFFTYSKIHPWDLLHLTFITRKVTNELAGMSLENRLNSKFSYDIRYRHPKKGYIRVQQNILPVSFTENGKNAIIIIHSSDISDVKKSTNMQYHFGYWENEKFKQLIKGKTDAYGNVLSDRELEVLNLLSEGNTSSQVADQLFLSPDTVRTHTKNILQKTESKNMTEAVKIAVLEGWI